MFIFTMSARRNPYLASNNSSKMASSKVFEHNNPIDNANRRAGLPAFRAFITAGTDAWQLIPTNANRSAPSATAAA
jgi:hypothetical protein